MLEPNMRLTYLEELQPPAGYVLDRAVATTFSLDLLALLMAPLSMALQQCSKREEMLTDPIAVLEALRMTAGRVTVFCQQGRMAVPRRQTLLYSCLESVVVDVQPPNREGVFHPKTWFLRFRPDAPGEPAFYRFLCLSRNMTFDHSWDTMLSLEGRVTRRKRAFSTNRPLAEFLGALPGMAVGPVRQDMAKDIARMVDEVLRTQFEAPEGFHDEDMAFYALGLQGREELPDFSDFRQLLVVSPFITDSVLRTLMEPRERNILVTRQQSLDELNDKTITLLEETTELYSLLDTAERPEDTDQQGEDLPTTVVSEDFSGLHAKLYIADKNDWYSQVLTGSANATAAGLMGTNTEFLVELWGKRRLVGVDHFLGGEDEKHAFRNMLLAYQRSGKVADDGVSKQLERALEKVRRAICSAKLSGSVRQAGDDTYDQVFRTDGPVRIGAVNVVGKCYPVTLKPVAAQGVADLLEGREVVFSAMSLPSLTSFLAFELTAGKQDKTASIGFVLNVPVSDMPSMRDKAVLHAVISDQAKFIRYLLFILAGTDDPSGLRGVLTSNGGSGGDERSIQDLGLPLLEELVRAFSRSPEKIESIARLVDDLSQSPQGETLLPKNFQRIWNVFLRARDEEALS